ncbi:hypothetical protein LEMLEM_LOCUS14804 [Lemmus lemmus]
MTKSHSPCLLEKWTSYSLDCFLLTGGVGIFRRP